MGSPERPRGNIKKKRSPNSDLEASGQILLLIAPFAIAVAAVPTALVVGGYYQIKNIVNPTIPGCDIDPQPKTITRTLSPLSGEDKVRIDKIIFKSPRSRVAGEIDIDQGKQPEENRIQIFPDGSMQFEGTTNGRVYSISKQPSTDKPGVTDLTIQADCKTPQKNPQPSS